MMNKMVAMMSTSTMIHQMGTHHIIGRPRQAMIRTRMDVIITMQMVLRMMRSGMRSRSNEKGRCVTIRAHPRALTSQPNVVILPSLASASFFGIQIKTKAT